MKAKLSIRVRQLPEIKTKREFDDFIEEVREELNPVMQHLNKDLRQIRDAFKWTWMTTTGNRIRIKNFINGEFEISLETRRHAMHADNGLAYYLNAFEKWVGVPREEWQVVSLKSKSTAPWYEAGVTADKGIKP